MRRRRGVWRRRFEDAVRVGAGPLDAGTIGRMAAVRIVSSRLTS
ncbi:MAG: hypothetical protein ACLUNV_06090 [Sutterella wadsworthensis]